jgi:hypothetical protein
MSGGFTKLVVSRMMIWSDSIVACWKRLCEARTERPLVPDPRPMSSAPLDGTPVRLFVGSGSAIASFWSEERSRKAFGAGDYREGWFLLNDDAVEVDDPMGWEPLVREIDRVCFENELCSDPLAL